MNEKTMARFFAALEEFEQVAARAAEKISAAVSTELVLDKGAGKAERRISVAYRAFLRTDPGAKVKRPHHSSDCAMHNEPAFPAGLCDCGADGSASIRVEVVVDDSPAKAAFRRLMPLLEQFSELFGDVIAEGFADLFYKGIEARLVEGSPTSRADGCYVYTVLVSVPWFDEIFPAVRADHIDGL